MQAADISLAKSEGDRGGHVIGHTRSGRPIYAVSSAAHEPRRHEPTGMIGASMGYGDPTYPERLAARFQGLHPGYTPDDHRDAAAHFVVLANHANHGMALNVMARRFDTHEARHQALHDAQAMGAGHFAAAGVRNPESHFHAAVEAEKSRSMAADRAQWAQEKAQRLAAKQARQEAKAQREADKQARAEARAAKKKVQAVKKSGEGSHGGHIIGHTRAGKAIYAPQHGHYENVPGPGEFSRPSKVRQYQAFAGALQSRFKDYRPHDHIDAATAHMGAALSARRKTDDIRAAHAPDKVDWHGVVQAHSQKLGHEHASLAHLAAAGHEDPFAALRVMEEAHTRQAGLHKSAGHGEGSRGGHVIGHTRSGKPIYGRRHAVNQGHKRSDIHANHALVGYTRDDHADAAARHMAAHRRSLAANQPRRARRHLVLSAHHSAIAIAPEGGGKPQLRGLEGSYGNHAGLALFHMREAEAKMKANPSEALWHFGQVNLHSQAAMNAQPRNVS